MNPSWSNRAYCIVCKAQLKNKVCPNGHIKVPNKVGRVRKGDLPCHEQMVYGKLYDAMGPIPTGSAWQ